ncbi:RNA polymerase factor sigma-54 [Rhizobiaceae bacterium]|nr:RNA polymerase factor sigma-54 [Rhizobiaceae bacterium]
MRQTASPALSVVQGQRQSLRMTPQLTQAISLLALSNTELAAFIAEEVEKNPLLLRDDGNAVLTSAPDGDTTDGLTLGDDFATTTAALSDELGTDLRNTFEDETPRPSKAPVSSGGERVDSDHRAFADSATALPTLRDHLRGQLALMALSRNELALAVALIEELCPAGYWTGCTDATAARFNCDNDEIDRALKALRACEPIGIAATSLTHCLALQLAARDRLDPAMQALLDNLPLLAARDFRALRSLTGLDDADLLDALAEIRTLNPKPATAFDTSRIEHIAADVIVTEAPDGSWRIALDERTLPRVLIDNEYATELARTTGPAARETQDFAATCLADADWLTRAVDQRARTLLKVTTEIVRHQDAFMIHGIRQLRPLTLSMVADAIGMHESTVSRVTTNKYVATPRGQFELKFFFTTELKNESGGEGHSSAAVRDRIRSLIDAESCERILSDDTLVTLLRNDGIEIARRTVAKYREGMKIASSVQRRREKRAQQSASRQAA